jgi:hypothetical protein
VVAVQTMPRGNCAARGAASVDPPDAAIRREGMIVWRVRDGKTTTTRMVADTLGAAGWRGAPQSFGREFDLGCDGRRL